MLLGEPAPTPYDWHFRLFGYPVRVSAWFWLAALLFGANNTHSAQRLKVPNWQALAAWAAAMFLSILIHELGHCLAFRKHGLNSRMVIYHFGGLAIPGSRIGGRTTSQNPWSQIEISAAGPVLQMLSGIILVIVLYLVGLRVPDSCVHPIFDNLLKSAGLTGGRNILTVSGTLFVHSYMYISIYWALFNLLPIYPLDGGQIARQLGVLAFGSQGIQYSLMLSIGVGGFIAYSFFTGGQQMMGLMFASFAYSSYQMLQSAGNSYRPW